MEGPLLSSAKPFQKPHILRCRPYALVYWISLKRLERPQNAILPTDPFHILQTPHPARWRAIIAPSVTCPSPVHADLINRCINTLPSFEGLLVLPWQRSHPERLICSHRQPTPTLVAAGDCVYTLIPNFVKQVHHHVNLVHGSRIEVLPHRQSEMILVDFPLRLSARHCR